MPSATFFSDGITATHTALRSRSEGMPFSGVPITSLMTSAAFLRRSTSLPSAAALRVAALIEIASIRIPERCFIRRSFARPGNLSGGLAAHAIGANAYFATSPLGRREEINSWKQDIIPNTHGINFRDETWTLRNCLATWRWRNGRSVPRPRQQAESRGCVEGFTSRDGERYRAHGALPARGASARLTQSSEHRFDLWPGRFGECARAGDGVGGRADPGRTDCWDTTPHPALLRRAPTAGPGAPSISPGERGRG